VKVARQTKENVRKVPGRPSKKSVGRRNRIAAMIERATHFHPFSLVDETV
jgi:hypothetical protein